MKTPETNAPVAVPMQNTAVAVALVIAGYLVMRVGVFPSSYLTYAQEAAAALGIS
jgi:hypothetical protein